MATTTTDWRQLCVDLIAASRQPWVIYGGTESHLIDAIWDQLEAIEAAVDADTTTTPTTSD
jgi:hypothetical protein